jgi:hypothetical protein
VVDTLGPDSEMPPHSVESGGSETRLVAIFEALLDKIDDHDVAGPPIHGDFRAWLSLSPVQICEHRP